MICYRDRTFCSRRECVNVRCDRNVTEEVSRAASAMGLGICLGDMRREGCGYQVVSVESESGDSKEERRVRRS